LDLARDLDHVCRIMDASFSEELALRGTSVHAIARSLRRTMPLLRIAAAFSPYVRQRMAGAVSLAGAVPVSVALMKPMGRDTARWYIGPVATEPAFRRRGHGRAALQLAIRLAARYGARFCLLDARVENRPAIRLYEGLGFRRYGGWDLLTAQHPTSAECPTFPNECQLRRMPLVAAEARFRVALGEASEERLAADPPTPEEFRIGIGERAATWVQVRMARSSVDRRSIYRGGEPVAWVSARRSRLGHHSLALHVTRAHADRLASPLADLACHLLRGAAELPVHARVAWGSTEIRAALEARGFRLTESNARLGRRVSPTPIGREIDREG
jgi:GNAT superfamily N-acetyltransferase